MLNTPIENYCKKYKQVYDVVCSFQVVEHIYNIYSFLNNQINCLKTRGILIISIPSQDSFMQFTTNDILNIPPHHMTRWRDKTLKNLENLYPIELINIEHEDLRQSHENWFKNTLINHIIYEIINIENKIIDISFKRKIISKLVNKVIAKIIPNNLLLNYKPNGHTVVAVFKKV